MGKKAFSFWKRHDRKSILKTGIWTSFPPLRDDGSTFNARTSSLASCICAHTSDSIQTLKKKCLNEMNKMQCFRGHESIYTMNWTHNNLFITKSLSKYPDLSQTFKLLPCKTWPQCAVKKVKYSWLHVLTKQELTLHNSFRLILQHLPISYYSRGQNRQKTLLPWSSHSNGVRENNTT